MFKYTLIIAVLALSACEPSKEIGTTGLVKAEDSETGVVCYLNPAQNAIHCFTAGQIIESQLAQELKKQYKELGK